MCSKSVQGRPPILCEDANGEEYLIGFEPSTGDLWVFALNAKGENESTSAPDGLTLDVTIQNP